MPEPPQTHQPWEREEDSRGLLLTTLHDEQTRLRAEVDRLRQEQQDLQKKLSEQAEQQKGDKDKDKDKDKKDEGGGDKKEDQDKEGGSKQDGKKEPAPAKAKHWARAHPVYTVLIVIGFVLLVIAGILIWRYISSYENTDDAQVDGHTDPISARISGFVVGAYVENTNRVKKGQVLVDLDPRDYEVSLAQARANLAQAEAGVRAQKPNVPITTTTQSTELANAELSVESAAASLAAAEHSYQSSLSDLKQSEANAVNAASEEQRYRQLVDKQEVSREIYDQRATEARAQAALVNSRRSTAEAALKNVEQSRAALAQAKRRLEESKNNLPRQIAIQHETLSTREANWKAAQAQANQALLNLTYCKIVAPEDGIIGDKSVQVGTQVTPGQEMLALTQTNDIWVTANFKETQIRNMRPGQSVTIHVDALSQDFNGFVEALPGATGSTYSLLPPENATGNYVKVVQRLPVRIRFKAGQPHAERLAPGMSVEPKVWVK